MRLRFEVRGFDDRNALEIGQHTTPRWNRETDQFSDVCVLFEGDQDAQVESGSEET